MSEPQQNHSSVLGYTVVAVSTGVANLLSYAQSFNAGALATGITIVGGGVIGFIVLWLEKVGPAWVRYKVYRDDAQKNTLSGRMADLSSKLDEAHEMVALQERQIALSQRLADDSERLANINRRQMERAEAERSDMAGQLAKMAGRLEDANKKLHDLSSPIQTAAQNSLLALQIQDDNAHKLDETLTQARRNAGLTGRVDDKATHIAATVDQIAGKASGEYPPIAPPGHGVEPGPAA